MKQRLVDISFEITGSVEQTIILTDPNISGEQLATMFNNGEAFTDIDDDGDIYTEEGVIGTVQFSDRELNYTGFQLEGSEYESESSLQPFNASRLAYAGAMGEFIAEDEELTLGDIHHILTLADDKIPIGLPIEEGYRNLTGRQLLREIDLMQHGLMNLMTIAHQAGKKGQEII